MQNNKCVMVVGDFMVDHYLYAQSSRISPEAPVQIAKVEKELSFLGGAGNVVNNLCSLGLDVCVLSVVGCDDEGDFICERLERKDIDTKYILKDSKRPTTKKSRIISQQQQILRIDHEESLPISQIIQDKLFDAFVSKIKEVDCLLLSDYGKGVLTSNLTQKMIFLAKKEKKMVLVDPKGSDFNKYKGATLITPNKHELSIALKEEIDDDLILEEKGIYLKNILDLKYLIVTLSADGMAIMTDKMVKIPTIAKDVFDVTGAGDTVIAAIAYALLDGRNIYETISFANMAAAVAVSKVGCVAVRLEDIESYAPDANKKIRTFDEISKVVAMNRNKKIIFTNGCFDILHAGHVHYLNTAKKFGDILILGLNSDASVQRLKGKSRPINKQKDRADVLAGLYSVDYIVIFDEDTPLDLIKLIKPDILVKGGDYEAKEIVGSQIAKETRVVQYKDGKSTTKIIQKVQALCSN